jgi:hypothetical protein
MAYQAHNFSLDDTYRLTAAVTHTAATNVETAATVSYIDLGEHATSYNGIDGAWSGTPPVPGTPTQGVYARFAVVIDIGAIDVTLTGSYQVRIEGADSADFSSGKSVLGFAQMGPLGQMGTEFDTPANSRRVFYLDNVSYGSSSTSSGTAMRNKRYIRMRIIAFYTAGSASLAINNAWMVPL